MPRRQGRFLSFLQRGPPCRPRAGTRERLGTGTRTEGQTRAPFHGIVGEMRVLIADDDDAVLMALELLLRHEGMSVTRARSPREVLASMQTEEVDALLLDLNYERDTTSGAEGFSLLDELRQRWPLRPVVVMTGWASIEGAVQAMRRGAVDYVPKPWDNARLVALLSGLEAKPQPGPSTDPHELASAAMQAVLATIDRVAFSDVPVLITGEHGTGKEIVARRVHQKSGRTGAFVAVDAGALAEGTLESELFGHVRGAFTDARSDRVGAFARAQDGTLFLDEIGNMPLAQQARLLRVLQERSFQPVGATRSQASTARIVSATNGAIDELAREQRFRPDLLYRLNAIRLHLPPLRERVEEIAGLARHFVAREAERYGLPLPSFEASVLPLLERHAWPGNVRELEHSMQRAVLLSAQVGQITEAHLGLEPCAAPAPTQAGTLRNTERLAVLRALEQFPDDRRAAARSLGLSRSAFYRRLAQFGIRPER